MFFVRISRDFWLKSSIHDEHADFGLTVLATCGQAKITQLCFSVLISKLWLVNWYAAIKGSLSGKLPKKLLEQVAIAVATSCYSVLYIYIYIYIHIYIFTYIYIYIYIYVILSDSDGSIAAGITFLDLDLDLGQLGGVVGGPFLGNCLLLEWKKRNERQLKSFG